MKAVISFVTPLAVVAGSTVAFADSGDAPDGRSSNLNSSTTLLGKVDAKHSILASRHPSALGRSIRTACIIGLVGLVSACAGSLSTASDPQAGGSCRGFAGMPVPGCDFYQIVENR